MIFAFININLKPYFLIKMKLPVIILYTDSQLNKIDNLKPPNKFYDFKNFTFQNTIVNEKYMVCVENYQTYSHM